MLSVPVTSQRQTARFDCIRQGLSSWRGRFLTYCSPSTDQPSSQICVYKFRPFGWFNIEIIVYDLIHCDIRKASVSKDSLNIRNAFGSLIFRDISASDFDSK